MSLSLSKPISRTLSEQAANELRQAILEGRLRPGQRIIEQEIAEVMKLSRGPVRDALKILENECLVVRYPHRGAVVASLTLRDAEEIYSLREALETLALEHAIKNATDEQIDELDQIVNLMAAKLEQNYSQVEVTDLDLQFHHTLCRISGHSRVLAAWTALRAQVRLLILTHRIRQPYDFQESGVEWHRQIVALVRQRDSSHSADLIHKHLMASFESAVQAIQQNEREATSS